MAFAIVGWSRFQETDAFRDCQWTQGTAPPRSKLASFAPCRQQVCFRRPDHGKLTTLALWILIFFFAVSSVRALDSSKRISQYAHTAWLIQDGHFSGTPQVMTQTADGYLWFGTNIGLVRFDGVRFITWNPPAGERLLDSRVFSLLGARDGSLWMGTGYSISHWKEGELVNYPQLSGRVEALVEDNEGSIWLARTQSTDGMGPVCRIKDEQLRCYGVTDGIPFPLAIQLEKSDSGELWVGGYSELCRWKPGSCTTYFTNTSRRPETFASLRAIVRGADGSVWAAIDRSGSVLQLEHFEHGSWAMRDFPGVPIHNSDITTLFVARDDALWVGTADHGIFRARGNEVDHFGSKDGLSSDAVGRFYQDTEGTLWVVTAGGIDNFRDLPVASYPMREGLSGAGASSVLASRDGTVWIGNFEALDFLRDGKLSAIRARHGLPGKFITTLCEDHAGRLWLGLDSDLWVYDRGSFRVVRHSDGRSLGIVFAITEDAHHSIWVRAGPNLDRIQDFTVKETLTSAQISTAYTLAATPDGGVVLGLVDGDLVKFRNGETQAIASNEVGNSRQIRDLLVETDGSVWGTTLDELFRWKDGVRRNLSTRNGLPCDGVFALVKGNLDSIWLYTKCGLIEIARSELDRWWQNQDSVVKVKFLDEFDGLQPGLTPLKPQATRTPDGRLWFVNGRLLQTIDPLHLKENGIPPPVHIEQILADRKVYLPRDHVRLPPLTRDLQVDYTALSFVAPQKVRFRYMLEGHDSGWQEPGTRRQAFYSDLRPGNYRFRVIACNNDGIWNQAGATLKFSVAPAWYQTNLFLLLSVAAGLFVAGSLYRLRLRQVARAISGRFDERLAERTRIARELHDTLLQGFLSASMQLHVADEQLSADSPAKPLVGRVLKLMGRVIEEGRDALRGLRSSKLNSPDLEQAFSQIREEFPMHSQIGFRVIVEGTPRPLRSIIRDEIYLIGHEALSNAFRHAHASDIEVELEYASSHLRVLVRDNGCGIDTEVLRSGRDGHWGLSGMKERTERIGGKLRVLSRPVSGTEVELSVPGRIAFEFRSGDQSARWLSRFYRGKKRNQKSQPGSEQAQ
jgi:signal transduction histidine kinase/ligand-binding sensor domain-containing protein